MIEFQRNGGAAVVSNSLTLAVGDVATCTINNNDSDQTDVSITKVASADKVVRGDEVVFTLMVRNPGVAAAPGTVVRDPAVAGLDCTAAGLAVPTCSATVGASCPTPLTATGLQAGVAIPALPAGSTVSIDLTCRATASGMPCRGDAGDLLTTRGADPVAMLDASPAPGVTFVPAKVSISSSQ